MAENSSAEGVVKFGLGLGVGFGLYLLIRNLGFGGGLGFGGERGDAGRGDGASAPPQPSSPPMPEPLPRDEQPLLYVAIHPADFKAGSKLSDPASRARLDAVFRPIDLGTAKLSVDEVYLRMSDALRRGRDQGTPPLSLDEVIARVQAGGRDDVRLITTGNIRSGTWDDVKDALMTVGIKHWLLWKEAPADRKPGEAPTPSRWDLYDKVAAVGNPDKTGHYLVENRGSAFWNLSHPADVKDPAPRVSGNVRGEYGRGHYRGYGR